MLDPPASLVTHTRASAIGLASTELVRVYVKVIAPRSEIDGLPKAWRLELSGTLKKESVRTIAVVVDREAGRVVLLLAGPAGAWGQVRPALERVLASLRPL